MSFHGHFMDMCLSYLVWFSFHGYRSFLAVMEMLQWVLLSVRGRHRVDLAKHVWRVQGGEHGGDGDDGGDGGDGGDGNGGGGGGDGGGGDGGGSGDGDDGDGGGGEHNDQDAEPTATLICDDY